MSRLRNKTPTEQIVSRIEISHFRLSVYEGVEEKINLLLPDVYILPLQPIQSPYRMFGTRRTIPKKKKDKKEQKGECDAG